MANENYEKAERKFDSFLMKLMKSRWSLVIAGACALGLMILGAKLL